jgi:hypothetical protein
MRTLREATWRQPGDERHGGGGGHQFVQQLQLLRLHLHVQRGHAGHIAARAAPKIFLQKRPLQKSYPLYGTEHFWTVFVRGGMTEISK